MNKLKLIAKYRCRNCSQIYSKWNGKCEVCGSWNTIEEINEKEEHNFHLENLSDINSIENLRISSGISELDLVLGGGFVLGSLVLLGGEPGVGKSTLMLSISEKFSENQKKVLYFSGEESGEQIKIRAKRLQTKGENIYISREMEIEKIIFLIVKLKPNLVIIDSVQTVLVGDHTLPGTVSQLKLVAFRLLEIAKKTNIPIILIGHITREGTIAGPKLLEHIVDTVLYFESDRTNHLRILRGIKNRFGNVGEVALFEMTPSGLKEVQTLSKDIDRYITYGYVYSAILEGSRAIGVEVQALVTRANYGQAKRMAEGLDIRRVIQLSAVLEKFLKINLGEHDIFTNLAGGLTSHEPDLDLAICASILSSYLEKNIKKKSAFIGEIGLTGEIRPTPRLHLKLKEFQNIGIEKIFLPCQKIDFDLFGIEICPIGHVKELLGVFNEGL
ncbi:MAG: DNA repair protein RadA [Leptonema sp. (in: bacteria)]